MLHSPDVTIQKLVRSFIGMYALGYKVSERLRVQCHIRSSGFEIMLDSGLLKITYRREPATSTLIFVREVNFPTRGPTNLPGTGIGVSALGDFKYTSATHNLAILKLECMFTRRYTYFLQK